MLNNRSLHASPVVANCRMNRERRCVGSNGYSYELNVDVIAFLDARRSRILKARRSKNRVSWLDVCCGCGFAIKEATELLGNDLQHFHFEGIDLAGHFSAGLQSAHLILHKTAFEDWVATQRYDLITCVHGLHYIGDKLGTIAKIVSCLADDGLFVANVDLRNFRYVDGRSAGRTVAKRLSEAGISYDRHRRLIQCEGHRTIDDSGMKYVGANDEAGPNYTGQPAVDSVYQTIQTSA